MPWQLSPPVRIVRCPSTCVSVHDSINSSSLALSLCFCRTLKSIYLGIERRLHLECCGATGVRHFRSCPPQHARKQPPPQVFGAHPNNCPAEHLCPSMHLTRSTSNPSEGCSQAAPQMPRNALASSRLAGFASLRASRSASRSAFLSALLFLLASSQPGEPVPRRCLDVRRSLCFLCSLRSLCSLCSLCRLHSMVWFETVFIHGNIVMTSF